MQKILLFTITLLITATILLSYLAIQIFNQLTTPIPAKNLAVIPNVRPVNTPQSNDLLSSLIPAAANQTPFSHPADIPPPPNAKLLHSQVNSSLTNIDHIATYLVKNSTAADVINYYQRACVAIGFTPVISGPYCAQPEITHNRASSTDDYSNRLFIRSLPADINKNGLPGGRQTLSVRVTPTNGHDIRIFVAFSYPDYATQGKINNP